MEKKLNNEEVVYQVSFDPYKIGIESKDNKKIVVDGKPIALSVGSQINMRLGFKCTLLIDVHYDSEHKDTLTEQIPQIEEYGSIVALNPKFKDKKIIDKLKELNIISQTLETVNYKNKEYELVKVNLDELMLYKPFGDSILKDYKSIEKHRESSKEKEI